MIDSSIESSKFIPMFSALCGSNPVLFKELPLYWLFIF